MKARPPGALWLFGPLQTGAAMEAILKAIEVEGAVDAAGRLHLDAPLPISGPLRVRVIILFPEQGEAPIPSGEDLLSVHGRPLPQMTTIITFDGRSGYGDKEYLQWCLANPNGFVLNALKNEHGSPPGKLHKACCKDITTGTRKNWTTTTYNKICSLDRQALVLWAHQNRRADTQCLHCKRRVC